MVIAEKKQAVLDNLHLIWVYYRLYYVHAQFQPSVIKIGVSIYETLL